jgi:hypothetical protein
MADTSTPTTTAHVLLTIAAETKNRVVTLPGRLPLAAQRSVAQSMLKAGLVEEAPAEPDGPAWRKADSGERFVLRATQAGLAAVGVGLAQLAQAAAAQATQPGPFPCQAFDSVTQPKPNPVCHVSLHASMRLRAAAEPVVTLWNGAADGSPALVTALELLRAALNETGQKTARRVPRALRRARTGTKKGAVLAMLRRPEGATVGQVADATGWAQHTVRGFFAGLKKKGITVGVLELVRQVGSGKQGAQGQLHRLSHCGGELMRARPSAPRYAVGRYCVFR